MCQPWIDRGYCENEYRNGRYPPVTGAASRLLNQRFGSCVEPSFLELQFQILHGFLCDYPQSPFVGQLLLDHVQFVLHPGVFGSEFSDTLLQRRLFLLPGHWSIRQNIGLV